MAIKHKKTAFAVVDWDMWHKDKQAFGFVFSPQLQSFIEAIFQVKEHAYQYCDRMSKQGMRMIVPPVELTYTMPETKGIRYKSYIKTI